jgi:hypothetical protein
MAVDDAQEAIQERRIGEQSENIDEDEDPVLTNVEVGILASGFHSTPTSTHHPRSSTLEVYQHLADLPSAWRARSAQHEVSAQTQQSALLQGLDLAEPQPLDPDLPRSPTLAHHHRGFTMNPPHSCSHHDLTSSRNCTAPG